jgi:hypothetical protein
MELCLQSSEFLQQQQIAIVIKAIHLCFSPSLGPDEKRRRYFKCNGDLSPIDRSKWIGDYFLSKGTPARRNLEELRVVGPEEEIWSIR